MARINACSAASLLTLTCCLLCGLSGCHAVLNRLDTGTAVNPDPAPSPSEPDVAVPADLQQQVSAALAGRQDEARRYAALYTVMAEEIRTTDRTLSQIRRDLPGAKPKLGLPEKGPLADITAQHFSAWAEGSEFTAASRRAFADACEVLAAACLNATQ